MATRSLTLTPVTPAILPRVPLAVRILVPAVILCGSAYAFNWALVESRGLSMTPLVSTIWFMMPSVLAMLTAVTVGWLISHLGELIPFREVAAGWLVTGLIHVVSGAVSIAILLTNGQTSGSPPTINLNVLRWDGPLGRGLNFLTIDEIFHLVAFVWWLTWAARIKHRWWIYVLFFLPTLAYAWWMSGITNHP